MKDHPTDFDGKQFGGSFVSLEIPSNRLMVFSECFRVKKDL